MDVYDYIIVGGGCIGASTAAALQKQSAASRILLVQGTHDKTASQGVRKIVREQYFDAEYVDLARVAMHKWKSCPPFREFYHHTGWIQFVTDENYRPFADPPDERQIQVGDVTLFREHMPVLDDNERLWFYENIGVADAALALKALILEMEGKGLKVLKDDIFRLILDNGECQGVELVDGRQVFAKSTILATGAWTPKLLKKSGLYEEHMRDFFQVTAVGVAQLQLSTEHRNRLQSMPILVAAEGEILPPTQQQASLQITSTATFDICDPDTLTGRGPDYDGDDDELLATRKGKNLTLLKRLLPWAYDSDGDGEDSVVYDFWPELMTPNQHPLVDTIPGVDRLTLAVGGSYHFYKFLPVIGEYIRDVLSGKREGIARKWTWRGSRVESAVHNEVVPAST